MHTEQEGRLVLCVGTGRKQCWVPHTQGVKTMETMEGRIVLGASHSRCEDYGDNGKED